MEALNHWLLTILIFLPTLGAAAVLLAPTRQSIRWTALIFTLLTLLAAALLYTQFDAHLPERYDLTGGVVQFAQRTPWIASLNVEYFVGIDGISLPFLGLTTFIFVLACISSWKINQMARGYFALLLLLETGLLGTFSALDFLLFYVFFEVSLVPMYFLIGIWGGSRRQFAAMKFFLFTFIGSLALLVVLIAVYLYSRAIDAAHLQALGLRPGGCLDLVRLAAPAVRDGLRAAGMSVAMGKMLFALTAFCFLIKAPGVPLHTWLPDAHVEAPTPISMLLAALLLKMGGYGLLRIAYPLFPGAARSMWLLMACIGIVGILYGALCALAQRDFKRLVAYSSVSHMGLVILGIAVLTPLSVNGAVFLMIAHGVISAMLFFIVGIIYERAHHREMSRLGGLSTTMPVYAAFSSIALFANLGLPLLCGFVGEVSVLFGTFQASRNGALLVGNGLATPRAMIVLAVLACLGMVLTAGYALWALQRVYLGPERPEYRDFPDLSRREFTVLIPLTVAAVLLGVLPSALLFDWITPSVSAFLKLMG